MCFTKTFSAPPVEKKDPVIRHEADASLTKNSKSNLTSQGFKQNIKTSAFGLDETANVAKKTLLGE